MRELELILSSDRYGIVRAYTLSGSSIVHLSDHSTQPTHALRKTNTKEFTWSGESMIHSKLIRISWLSSDNIAEKWEANYEENWGNGNESRYTSCMYSLAKILYIELYITFVPFKFLRIKLMDNCLGTGRDCSRSEECCSQQCLTLAKKCVFKVPREVRETSWE